MPNYLPLLTQIARSISNIDTSLKRIASAIEQNSACNLRNEQRSIELTKRMEAREEQTLKLHQQAVQATRALSTPEDPENQ